MEILYSKLQSFSLFFLDGATYFLIAMIGAFVKDIYDTVSGTRQHIETRRVFVATSLSTFLTFAARGHVDDDKLIAITFILGVIGWELFSRICTIEGFKSTVLGLKEFYVTLLGGKKPTEKNNENNEDGE